VAHSVAFLNKPNRNHRGRKKDRRFNHRWVHDRSHYLYGRKKRIGRDRDFRDVRFHYGSRRGFHSG
jgi:hypothetical protein